MGVLDVGITALNAFRSQLTTTSHNVANVNTEGYTRQVVQLGTLPPNFTGVGYIGNGVKVEEVARQFDQFLAERVRTYTSSYAESEVYLDRASRIDNILADPDAGLSVALQNFFNSVQDVADDPSSVTTRDVMLSSATILSDRFHSVFNFMESMRSEVNQDVETLVQQVNRLSENIAQVNAAIQSTTGNGSPNDLLDKRDQLINELSELVSVTTVQEDSGAMNVYIGNGQGLVIGTNTFSLATKINDNEPDRVEIVLNTGSQPYEITNSLKGGMLGGYLRFRQEVLDPAENALGRLATGLAFAFNEQHQLGVDLNGNLGNEFFNIPVPTSPASDDPYVQQMVASLEGNGSVFVAGLDPAELRTSDYEITNRGSGIWIVESRETQSIVDYTNNGDGTITFEGVTVDVSSSFLNDKFAIRPTRLASRAFDVALNDGRQIATASAMLVSKGDQTIASPTINSGTAEISNGGLISRESPITFSGSVKISFVSDADGSGNPGFTVGNAGIMDIREKVANTNADYVTYDPTQDSGKTYILTISGYGEFEFTLNGSPNINDAFTFSVNTDGVGDNGNALKLAALQTEKTMRNTSGSQSRPTSSFTELYSSMIGDVGSQTRQALINNETQSRLKDQAQASYDEVSGVNLDEEAANLVHFQQAYQAATQVIRVSNQLFDSLLNSI